jgi:methylamine dehydrogenase heavy chain
MRWQQLLAAGAAGTMGMMLPLSAAVFAQQAPEFVPEQVTTKVDVGPGPHLYVAGEQRIHVIDPIKLKYLGQISTGGRVQYAFSAKGDEVYLATTFYSRGWTGEREDVLQVYDTTTLAAKTEYPVIEKVSMGGAGGKWLSPLSLDGRWMFIQNATPAISVQLVDLSAKTVTGEIPTPGCWGIFPSMSAPLRFTTLCGDGKLTTHTLNGAGSEATAALSDKIFDADTDPLFVDAERAGDTLIFTSFNGNIYEVSVAGQAAKLTRKFSIVEGVEGGWKPGGMQVTSYLGDSNILYVLMHDKAYDGSHTDAGKEVWAVDMKKRAVISRSTIRPAKAIFVAGGDKPALFSYGGEKEDTGVARYAIDKTAAFTVREDVFKKLAAARPRLEVR